MLRPVILLAMVHLMPAFGFAEPVERAQALLAEGKFDEANALLESADDFQLTREKKVERFRTWLAVCRGGNWKGKSNSIVEAMIDADMKHEIPVDDLIASVQHLGGIDAQTALDRYRLLMRLHPELNTVGSVSSHYNPTESIPLDGLEFEAFRSAFHLPDTKEEAVHLGKAFVAKYANLPHQAEEVSAAVNLLEGGPITNASINASARKLLDEKKYNIGLALVEHFEISSISPADMRERYAIMLAACNGGNYKKKRVSVIEKMRGSGFEKFIPIDDLIMYARFAGGTDLQEALKRYDLIFLLHPELAGKKQFISAYGDKGTVDLERIEYERFRCAKDIDNKSHEFFKIGDSFVEKYSIGGKLADEAAYHLIIGRFEVNLNRALEDMRTFLTRFPDSRRAPAVAERLLRALVRKKKNDEFFNAARIYGRKYADTRMQAEVRLRAMQASKSMAAENEAQEELHQDLADSFRRTYMNMTPTKINFLQRIESLVFYDNKDYEEAVVDCNFYFAKNPDALSRLTLSYDNGLIANAYLYANALYNLSDSNIYRAKSLLEDIVSHPEDEKRSKDTFVGYARYLLEKIDQSLMSK